MRAGVMAAWILGLTLGTACTADSPDTDGDSGTDSDTDTHTDEDTDTDVDTDEPLPTPIETDVRNHIFGHSLLFHSDRANVPRWMAALSSHAGYRYRMSGQYGFMETHATNLPPFPQWGIPGVEGLWDEDSGERFSDVNVNTVLMTEANFRQYHPADEVDPDVGGQTTVESTLAVMGWVDGQEAGVRYVIYENWPDMAGFTSADFDSRFPSASEMAAYHAETRGDFHDWWVHYQDAVRQARPGADVDLIPVGSVMSTLLQGRLADVPVEALYEDDAPHGTPTLYFLAGLVTYMGVYGVPAPEDYVVPDEVHPLVRARYGEVVDDIWAELKAFVDEDGNSRTW